MTRVIVFVMLGILLVGGVFAVDAAFTESGDDIQITNETFTDTTAGNIVELDDSKQTGAFYENETTVFNDSDAKMEENTDYQWFEVNGTLKVLSGGDLAGDANGTVSYSYDQTTEEQRGLAKSLKVVFDGGVGLLFLAAIIFLVWIVTRL